MNPRASFASAFVLLAAVTASARLAFADPTLNTLMFFNGANGSEPMAGLVADADGNLYGVTQNGGPGTTGYQTGKGTVFELSGPNHTTFTSLFQFNGTNGQGPQGPMVIDAAGNLYGITYTGGANNKGSVFELSGPNHSTFTTLISFNGTNGKQPNKGLAIDSAGNLYGSTYFGGPNDFGTVFELSGTNHQTLTTLATGNRPFGPVTLDANGDIYGTTSQGGPTASGSIFKLSGPTHQTMTVLATFNGSNGSAPDGSVLVDKNGNVYGTTNDGGINNDGTVWEYNASTQTLSDLVLFNGSNGLYSDTGLIMDGNGDLYGTSYYGGANNRGGIFKLSGPNHQTITTLYSFNITDGLSADSDLIADAAGNLYGSTSTGGPGGFSGYGTVYELSNTGFVPTPEPTTLPLLLIALPLLTRRRKAEPVA